MIQVDRYAEDTERRPGDPDDAAPCEALCNSDTSNADGYWCTLAAGHAGDHIAGMGGPTMGARWPA
jgi:hypothetical protein